MTTQPPLNPYESPREVSEPPVEHLPVAIVAESVRWPAMWLLGLSGFQMVISIAFIGFGLVAHPFHELLKGQIWGLLVLIGNLLLFCGAFQMLQLRHLKFCRLTALVAIIPFISPLCFVGIPFGIWALVVLAQPKVEAEFKRMR